MEEQQNKQTELHVEQVEPMDAPVEQPVAEEVAAATEDAVVPVAGTTADVVEAVATPAVKATPTEADTTIKRNARKERVGKVTSNKMQKTITVAINRQVKDVRYGKFRTLTKKLTVHDENNDCSIGDTVRVMETRPLSKNKRWRLVEIIERAK